MYFLIFVIWNSMKRLYILLIFVLLINKSFASSIDSELAVKLDSINNYAYQTMQKNHVPGMSLTVMIDSNIVLSKQYGYTDLTNKIQVKKSTIFRIASLSKVITSAAVMKLLEQHQISLDSSINKYVRNFSKKKWDIPVKYLLNHTAGIRHYKGNEFYSPGNYRTIQDAIKIFNKDSLLFEPGTNISYSSYGYNLLGAMIENVTNKPFQQYVYENFISPIKCKNIIPEISTSNITNKTKFYMYEKDSVIVECPNINVSYKLPTGGYLASSDDFAKLTYNIFCGNLLSDSVANIYKSGTYLNNNKSTYYSYGLRMSNVKKETIYWHLGSTYGSSSAVVIDPKKKITIVWITNLNIKWTDEAILKLMEFLI